MEHPAIMGIGTAVPEYRLDQADVTSRLSEALTEYPEVSRWMKRIFTHCGVATRYTCESGFLEPAVQCRYIPLSSEAAVPSTEERMKIYRDMSTPLAAKAAKEALADSGTRFGEVTHLIAVSCTGMFLPGLDAELAWQLKLAEDVQRIPLNFMGCAAGLTALRHAEEIVRNDPAAKVLVVTVELCSLHIQPSFAKEDLFTAAFFGDGASACVVGMTSRSQNGAFEIRGSRAVLFSGASDDMIWTIGNHGFQLRLSPQIPRLIADCVPPAFRRFWGEEPLPELWAIHPGGRGIVDALQAAFQLADHQTNASRSILRNYGNMSSATILFVLDEIRKQRSRTHGRAADGIALAFGPGVSAEFLRIAYHP